MGSVVHFVVASLALVSTKLQQLTLQPAAQLASSLVAYAKHALPPSRLESRAVSCSLNLIARSTVPSARILEPSTLWFSESTRIPYSFATVFGVNANSTDRRQRRMRAVRTRPMGRPPASGRLVDDGRDHALPRVSRGSL